MKIIQGGRQWAKRKVRSRLKAGWCAWVSPARTTVWARYRVKAGKIDTAKISADELAVLDEVLAEAK